MAFQVSLVTEAAKAALVERARLLSLDIATHAARGLDAHHAVVLDIPFVDASENTVAAGTLKLGFVIDGALAYAKIPLGEPPQLLRIAQPVDVTDTGHDITTGHRANPTPFAVTVLTGTPPITYQWEVNTLSDGTGAWVPLSGPDGTSLTAVAGQETLYAGATTAMLVLRPGTGGIWRWRCKVTNLAGTVTSSVVTLTEIDD